MTEIILRLGCKFSIDGDVYTVVSVSEVLDGDLGCGQITRKKILKIRAKSGFEQVIMQEEEE